MIGVVEFLFFPRLIYPRKEHEIHEGRKRIDIVMENSARTGVFADIATIRNYPCAHVFFECKNYGREVGDPELDQLSGRFSRERGKVGFLCCRQFEDQLLRDAMSDAGMTCADWSCRWKTGPFCDGSTSCARTGGNHWIESFGNWLPKCG